MGPLIIQVDTFTNKPFRGNPAAICFLEEAHDKRWMQEVAMEMNLSETAFIYRKADDFQLRWFTPTTEVDLCGHATLASAHVLWQELYLPADKVARFHTRSGLLSAKKSGEWIEIDLPAELEKKSDPPPRLQEALGTSFQYVGKNRFDYLVELESEQAVRDLAPDLRVLNTIATRGIIVTSRAQSEQYDFISRFFAPGAGIPEDPVTGSAHCCLGPYWRRRLNREKMTAYQASPRGGTIRLRFSENRVLLAGQAVTVLKGRLSP